MRQPPYGYCIPVKYIRYRDGDTVIVQLRTGQDTAIRLDGIDTPERGEEGYQKANDLVNELLETADEIALWIPLPGAGKDGKLDVIDILHASSFDRIPGRLFADGLDVSEVMSRFGYRRTK